jgi:hypothetical protein
LFPPTFATVLAEIAMTKLILLASASLEREKYQEQQGVHSGIFVEK